MSRFTRPALAFATCAAMLSLSACSALPFGNKDDDDEDTPARAAPRPRPRVAHPTRRTRPQVPPPLPPPAPT